MDIHHILVIKEMLSGSARNLDDVVVGARTREWALRTYISAVLGPCSALAVGIFNMDAALSGGLCLDHLLIQLRLLRLEALRQNVYLLLLLGYFVLIVHHLCLIVSLGGLLPFSLTLNRV